MQYFSNSEPKYLSPQYIIVGFRSYEVMTHVNKVHASASFIPAFPFYSQDCSKLLSNRRQGPNYQLTHRLCDTCVST